MAKDPTQGLQEYDEWEELGDDNGDVITFTPGTKMEGFFVKVATVTLPEDKQINNKGERQETANLLVFARNADMSDRWSVWENYQLGGIALVEADFYRIECTGERKVSQGMVKIFSVKHRVTKREEAF